MQIAGLHGISGGIFSSIDGGSFGSGFASGAVSSLIASGVGALGKNAGVFSIFSDKDVMQALQYAAGGLSGGISSALAGGKFWQGAKNGLIVTGLNHLADHTGIGKGKKSNQSTTSGKDPEKPGLLKRAWRWLFGKRNRGTNTNTTIEVGLNFEGIVDHSSEIAVASDLSGSASLQLTAMVDNALSWDPSGTYQSTKTSILHKGYTLPSSPSRLRRLSTGLKYVGNGLAGVSMGSVEYQRATGQITNTRANIEQTSNIIGLRVPAWTIGWEGARLITEIPGYHQNVRVPIRTFFGFQPDCSDCPF